MTVPPAGQGQYRHAAYPSFQVPLAAATWNGGAPSSADFFHYRPTGITAQRELGKRYVRNIATTF